jgi:hypothetical protein
MATKTTVFFLILLAICLLSCDPAIGVVIANRTTTAKKIKVIYPPDFTFPGDTPHNLGIRDSLKTYDLAVKDKYLHPTVIPMLSWDTVARTYSFNLSANHEAIVESRFLAPFPTFGQVFIIDNTDTVKLQRHGKDFRKRPKLLFGGTWMHKITDNK